MSSLKLLRYYFLTPYSEDDANKALKIEAEIIDGEITVSGVRAMAQRVLTDVGRTGGRVKSILFSSHGNLLGFSIGKDWVSLETLRKQHLVHLAMLTPFFAPDATVFLSGCNVGHGKLPRELSKIFGGVKVVGWKDYLTVKYGGWFKDYLEYPDGRVVCKMDRCKGEPNGFPRADNKPRGW